MALTPQQAIEQYNAKLRATIEEVKPFFREGVTRQSYLPALEKLAPFVQAKDMGAVEYLAANNRLEELLQRGGFADISGAYFGGQGGSSLSSIENRLGAFGMKDPSRSYVDELGRQREGDQNFWKAHDSELANLNAALKRAGIQDTVVDPFASIRQSQDQTMAYRAPTAQDIAANAAAPTSTTAPSGAVTTAPVSTTTIPGTNVALPTFSQAELDAAKAGGAVTAAAVATPTTNIPFKAGLTDVQKQSIVDLLARGNPLNTTDAQNYAYAIGDPNWKQYVDRKITPSGAAIPTAATNLTPGSWISPSKWKELQAMYPPEKLESMIDRRGADIYVKGGVDQQASTQSGLGGAMPESEAKTQSPTTYDVNDILTSFRTTTDRSGVNTLRDELFKAVNGLQAFKTSQRSALEASLGTAALKADIDKARASLESVDSLILETTRQAQAAKNKMLLNYEAIKNQPVSASIISGELAHQQRLDSISMDALNGQLEILNAQKQIANGQYNKAVDTYNAAIKQINDSVQDAVDAETARLSYYWKELDRLEQNATEDERNEFAIKKMAIEKEIDAAYADRKTVADLIANYAGAGILPADSLAEASAKVKKIYGVAGIIDPKFSDVVIKDDGRGNTNIAVIDKRTGRVLSRETLKGFSNPEGGSGGGSGGVIGGGVTQAELNKLLNNYPATFKTYVQSIVPSVTFKLNAQTISELYKQTQDIGLNKSFYTEATLPASIKDQLIDDVSRGYSLDKLIGAYPDVDSNYIKRLYNATQ